MEVTPTKEERDELQAISTTGKRAARTVLHARALLLLDAGEHGPKLFVEKVAEAGAIAMVKSGVRRIIPKRLPC